MFREAFANPWWRWLVPGFITTMAGFTTGFLIDKAAPERRKTWLKILVAILTAGSVLAMIVGLVGVVLSGLTN